MDIVSQTQRSENMRKIRSADTKPEMMVRRTTYRLGYRYRLHRKDLPGKPDLVFASRKKVIFVNGCFWHLHKDCVDGRVPSSNSAYWIKKLRRNVERDRENIETLRENGWKVLVLWECEVEKWDNGKLEKKIAKFLENEA